MRCVDLGPLGIMCGPDVADAAVTGASGTVYRFDFDERFGPLVIGRRGNPVNPQPHERHEFWPAFEAWLDKRRGLPPKCAACKGSGTKVSRVSRRVALGTPCPNCGGAGRLSPVCAPRDPNASRATGNAAERDGADRSGPSASAQKSDASSGSEAREP